MSSRIIHFYNIIIYYKLATLAGNLLFINHYKIKSKKEWELKIKTVNNYGYMKGKWTDRPFDKNDENSNVRESKKILRYVPKLKLVMDREIQPNPKKKPYFLVIVCMFREENQYLKEWIEYHILQGVNHFYLYDNENPRSTMRILKPYIKNNYVTVIKWPDNKLQTISEDKRRKKWSDYTNISTQNLAFMDFTKKFKDEYNWVIKIDVDEFIYPSQEFRNVRQVLRKKFDINKTKGIVVRRTDFGSNGHINKPDGLVIENFTRHEMKSSSYKSIGNNKFIKYPSKGAHSFDFI